MDIVNTAKPPLMQSTGAAPAGRNNPGLFLKAADVEGQKADVLLTHGLGEHSDKYNHVGRFFAGKGYRLCTYDLRGHGRSPGKRGHIRRYEELLDDLETAMNHFRREGTPMFLYGHSFGAQITLNYLLQRHPPVAGAIIASPLLKLAFRPSPLKVFLANIIVNLWPSFTQSRPVDRTLLTRDQEFLNSLPGQEMLHYKVSAQMYHEILAGAARIRENTSPLGCPLLVIQGSDDQMVSVAATQEFFENVDAPDKTLKIHPGMKHETQNEIGRETVLAEIVEWMDKRLPVASSGIV